MKPGIYLNDAISMDEYVADPCVEPSLSTGVVDNLVSRSPLHAHYFHPRLGGNDSGGSRKADIGTVAHHYLLGGDKALAVLPFSDFRKKEARERRDAAEAQGMVPILERDFEIVREMVAPAREALAACGAGDTEVTILAQIAGAWQRSRADWLSSDRRLVVDYKTTARADPKWFLEKIVCQNGYDVQATLQLEALDHLFGSAQREYRWLIQESSQPHATAWAGLSESMRLLAAEKIQVARGLWRECLDSKTWPGYDQEVHYAEPPAWVSYDWQARALAYFENREVA